MEMVIATVLDAGKSALNTAVYVLLPIMLIATIIMRLLDAIGLLGMMRRVFDPMVQPLGLTGLGAIAILQAAFVGFAAPIPILAMMERNGESNRRMAALFAAILTVAPGNALFPLAVIGVSVEPILVRSLVASILSAAIAYWILGRNLGSTSKAVEEPDNAENRFRLLQLISESGSSTIKLIGGIIPMLVLSLTLVLALQRCGAVDAFSAAAQPILMYLGIDRSLVVIATTKMLAGGTALVGVAYEMAKTGALTSADINRAAPLLLQPLDLPGLAIFASAVPALGRVMIPAVGSALVGIAFRVMMGS